jgi:hypothetical protein
MRKNKMEINDIVSVVATSGEYIGKYKGVEDGSLTLEDPRMIIRADDGGMGFARGIAVTGEENPTSVTFNNYVFVVPTNEKIAGHYQEATGSIVTPPKTPTIIT